MTLTGETITLLLEHSNPTIGHLKRLIEGKEHIPVNEQHLFLKDSDDEELKDGNELSAHGIRNKSTLYLKVGISQPALPHTLSHCLPH